jgi:collagen type I/II/III/V/XI/XXIV/XXVII alpha
MSFSIKTDEKFTSSIINFLANKDLTTSGSSSSGPTGVQGAQGPTGVQGAQGPTGVQGSQGPTGVQGAQGPTGVQGSQGPTGVQGSQGPTGVQGSQGPTGVQGAQGPALFNLQIYNGSPIINKPNSVILTGSNQGISTVESYSYNTYTSLYFQARVDSGAPSFATGTEYMSLGFLSYFGIIVGGNQIDLWGPGGSLGAATLVPGSIFSIYLTPSTAYYYINGLYITSSPTAGAPPGPQQVYINALAGYPAPPNDTVITDISVYITGTQGPTGAQGSQGSVGATGPTGAQGSQGSVGATGSTGAQGSQGSVGATGSTGAAGFSEYLGAWQQGTQVLTGGDGIINAQTWITNGITMGVDGKTVTINTTGVYRVDYRLSILYNDTVSYPYQIYVYPRVNGSNQIARATEVYVPSATQYSPTSGNFLYSFTVGDIFQLYFDVINFPGNCSTIGLNMIITRVN